MSTLTSTSTLAEIRAAYADNASYFEDGSVVKCKKFITSCIMLLEKVPSRASHGGTGAESVELNVNGLQNQLDAARKWLAANGGAAAGGASVQYVDFGASRE